MKPTLLVLAAGMGSRYGSLKQMDAFGPSGETIIDYSVYDAIRAGFGKVVFVIRPSIEEEFKKVFLDKFAGKVAVDYVFQELHMLPEGFSLPAERTKPWGTAHAVWVAKDTVHEPFAVINGDDFYGAQSFQLVADFLRSLPDANAPEYCIAGFPVLNTLSEHGSVSRAVCETDANGYLRAIVERTQIAKTGDNGVAYTDANGNVVPLSGKETVSMNLMGFTPSVFAFCEQHFTTFLQANADNAKAEFYLPLVLNGLVQASEARVKIVPTPEQWFGVTYREDKPLVIERLNKLIQAGVYPGNLWA